MSKFNRIVTPTASLRAFIWLTAALILTFSSIALAKGRFGQIVLGLSSKREFNYSYDQGQNAIVLEISNTAASELSSLEQYDETLLRRVLVKDLGDAGCEARLVLKDRNLRASIQSFDEPFRITVDVFDVDYEPTRDPKTGMPLADQDSAKNQSALPDSPKSAEEPKSLAGAAAPAAAALGSAAGASDNGKGRRLLQPVPELFEKPESFLQALEKAGTGPGKGWSEYPLYIYRLQTAAYEAGNIKDVDKKDPGNANVAMTSAESMADFAGKQYDFGHEGRALLAYQQVLHKQPSIFETNPLHLWRFAEIHFGQGNLTLADGYYSTLAEKFPEHPLSKFSKLRRIDIQALQAIRKGDAGAFDELAKDANAIKGKLTNEFVAQVAIRLAYWQVTDAKDQKQISDNKYYLPLLNLPVRSAMVSAFPNVEGQRTAFIGASLLLNDMLRDGRSWTADVGTMAAQYFDKYQGPLTEQITNPLHMKVQDAFEKNITGKVQGGDYASAVADYEALPVSLQDVKTRPHTAWALGESYRNVGQSRSALPFYALAVKASNEGPDRFKSIFWLAVTANDTLNEVGGKKFNGSEKERLTSQMHTADKAMEAAWNDLSTEDKHTIYTAYKGNIERVATSSAHLKTPPKIVLNTWTQALGTTASTTTGASTDWNKQFSPSASTVHLASDLAKRFDTLGMQKERKTALNMLKNVKPADMKDDKEAKKLWANQLVGLAEDYRKANENLEAGRIYALTGTESEDWENRAAALYKGGLLLLSAGRRGEAVDAFKKASEDTNNLFYANLAKERLNQIGDKNGGN